METIHNSERYMFLLSLQSKPLTK